MRDLLIFAMVFGSLPYILKHTYIGILVWSWLSYMNPHRLTWGAAYDFPFAQLVAATLFVSLVFNKEAKTLPRNHITIIWLLFFLWMIVSNIGAYYPDAAWTYFSKVVKIQLILLFVLMMMGSEQRIRLMIWVIFFSVGFFGIKGGVFFLTQGGRVWGPAGSFIADNNHLAVALLMVAPLGVYLLRHEVTHKALKWALGICVLLIMVSVIGSFSRGALLATTAVALYFWWGSKSKMITGMMGVVVIMVGAMFVPQSWYDRMDTIGEYDKDASALQRLNAWGYAINVANARVTGGGFESWSAETFAQWADDPSQVFVAHSIYFSVLADHGWVGLGLFLLLFFATWRMAGNIRKTIQRSGGEEDQWMGNLAEMIRVSLVAYASGGAFLSLAYFDLPWHLVAIVVLLDQLMRKKGLIKESQPAFGSAASGSSPPAPPPQLGTRRE